MATELDLRAYKSMMSDRVTPGTYLAQVEDVDASDLNREKKPQMRVELRLLDNGAEGQTLIERLTLDPSSGAMFRTVGFLSALGIPTPRKKIKFDENRLVGRKLMVEVADNEWNGRVTSQVGAWLKLNAAATDLDIDDDLDDAADEPFAPPAAPAAPAAADDDEAIDLDELDI